MNKAIIFSMIAYILASSTYSFGMFKFLRYSDYQARKYARMYEINNHALPARNIFTLTESTISAHGLSPLLEDVYSRNTLLEKHTEDQLNLLRKIDSLLKQQTNIIIDHTYHGEFLNRKQLAVIEKEIKKNYVLLAEHMCYCEGIVSEYKPKNHANE